MSYYYYYYYYYGAAFLAYHTTPHQANHDM